MKFASAFQINAISITYSNSNALYTQFYGSNTDSVFSDTGNDTTNLTAVTTNFQNPVGTGNNTVTSILSTLQFIYVVMLANCTAQYCQGTFSSLQIQSVGGNFSPLSINTDFAVTASTSNGAPIITYTDSTTNNLTYNLDTLLISESYRRIYPVIHDTSNIFFGGSNTNWNISSNSNSTNLCFNYNSANKCFMI